ncbi:BTB/POZ and MATH domain-containing protein 4 [Striga hermonthica]|uniref:BTB/POZ and MATH domain-containing protein 4 n=1 Tax=Striga hermonthica TaxID=68872 RepID=A0A9N7NP45_STRHE|nr:BTB/POZ and MATH domain-containing protein 4 [Striga hermonthica]
MEEEVGKLHKSHHMWELRDYSRHKAQLGAGQAVQSREFMAGGHRWAIVFYPNGRDSETRSQGYASIFLSLRSESDSGVQFLHGMYALAADGGVDWGINLFKLRLGIGCLRRGQQSGSTQFIKRSVLESPDNGYLKDDCLKLLCTIGILDCPFPINHPFLRFPRYTPATANGESLKEIWSSLCKEVVRCKKSACAVLRRELLASSISFSSAAPKGKLLESVIWRLGATKLKHKMKDD